MCSPWRGRQVEKTVGPRKGLSLLNWGSGLGPICNPTYSTSLRNKQFVNAFHFFSFPRAISAISESQRDMGSEGA